MEASEDKAAILGEIFETDTAADEIHTTGAEEIPTTGAEEAPAESFLLGYASFLGSQTDSQTPLASEDFTPNTR